MSKRQLMATHCNPLQTWFRDSSNCEKDYGEYPWRCESWSSNDLKLLLSSLCRLVMLVMLWVPTRAPSLLNFWWSTLPLFTVDLFRQNLEQVPSHGRSHCARRQLGIASMVSVRLCSTFLRCLHFWRLGVLHDIDPCQQHEAAESMKPKAQGMAENTREPELRN